MLVTAGLVACYREYICAPSLSVIATIKKLNAIFRICGSFGHLNAKAWGTKQTRPSKDLIKPSAIIGCRLGFAE